jgi:hypothetical protein
MEHAFRPVPITTGSTRLIAVLVAEEPKLKPPETYADISAGGANVFTVFGGPVNNFLMLGITPYGLLVLLSAI